MLAQINTPLGVISTSHSPIDGDTFVNISEPQQFPQGGWLGFVYQYQGGYSPQSIDIDVADVAEAASMIRIRSSFLISIHLCV